MLIKTKQVVLRNPKIVPVRTIRNLMYFLFWGWGCGVGWDGAVVLFLFLLREGFIVAQAGLQFTM